MAKTITVDISATGEVKVEAHGFKGSGCEAATKAIEAALGETSERKKKTEYYQASVGTAQKQGIG